ncbi:CHAT domain-containing protein [Streptomyces sp. MD20-1-1]|uniref:CHAT domain-containing protein n=1 Tax=Streptomyces sp. MD20-1-1 TaxID=3028668 RepID=UPI0029B55015|nr:CHAT domain-containing protein [Streptomyces sp. MD20-1-1]
MDPYTSALTHWDEFDRTSDADQLALAVDLLRVAHATDQASEDRYRCENDLGLALSRLYDQTYDLELLRESIDLLRGCLQAESTSDGRAYNLALSLQKYSVMRDDLTALDESIALMREVSECAEVAEDLRARVLSALSTALQDRYEMASDPQALAEGVAAARASLVITPDGHPRRGPHLAHLGLALRMTYECTGDLSALEEAVEVGRAAVRAIEDDVPSKDIEMGSISLALRVTYEATGDLAALDESILWLRQAITSLPESHGRQAPHHSNLSLALWTRYERTGDLAVLREAVGAARTAVTRTDPTSSDHRLYSNNLGLVLWSLHERDPLSDALDEAIDHFRSVLAATDESRTFFHQTAANLAVALRARSLRRGSAADLRDAISAGELADRAAAATHVDRQRYLSLLGTLHQDRYRVHPDPADLDKAVSYFRAAVAATSVEHPDHALFQLNLGTALLEQWRAEHAADEGRLTAARDVLHDAAGSLVAPPRIRVAAARAAGDAAAEVRDWPGAVRSYGMAVGLLPQVAPGHLDLADRGRELGRFLGLASDAAAAAFHCGDPQAALQLLEDGRGLLLGTVLDDVPLLDELRRDEPELADAFVWTRQRLDRVGPDPAGMPRPHDPEADDRHAAGAEWGRLLERIRAIPGFGEFLRPTPVAELIDGAGDVPVIVLNTSRLRCDAVVLRAGSVVHVPLPLLEHDSVRARARDLRRAIDAVADSSETGRPAAERRFGETFDAVCGWLFRTVLEPVLTVCGPVDRVHWLPTGALTALPLHAAGEHVPGDFLDRAVSSYTATLRGLRAPAPATSLDSVLIVSGEQGLRAAEREADALEHLLGADHEVLRPEPSTVRTVLTALPSCSLAHIALHGYSDPENPLASCLELADGDLHVPAISRLRLPSMRLAYLSACDTAAPDDGWSDEPVHLAAAFRAAGCRHVIATLWPAEDDSAAEVALDFYAGGVPEDPAVAINRAQRRRRAAAPASPLSWGPFEHWGVLG